MRYATVTLLDGTVIREAVFYGASNGGGSLGLLYRTATGEHGEVRLQDIASIVWPTLCEACGEPITTEATAPRMLHYDCAVAQSGTIE